MGKEYPPYLFRVDFFFLLFFLVGDLRLGLQDFLVFFFVGLFLGPALRLGLPPVTDMMCNY